MTTSPTFIISVLFVIYIVYKILYIPLITKVNVKTITNGSNISNVTNLTNLIRTTKRRNLIYLCFTGDKYFQIAKLLIKSIHRYLTRTDTDILLRTDPQTLPIVEEWIRQNPKSFTNKNISFILHASNKKMHEYRAEIDDNFKQYDKILYLDTDILIATNHINSLFDEELQDNTLYVVQESNDFNRPEWGYTRYNAAQQLEMVKRNQLPFNNGQFLFRYSPQMKAHFDGVLGLMNAVPYNPFIDQQSMNHYFNTRFLTNGQLLPKYTQLFATDQVMVTTPGSKKTIFHFSGNIHEGDWKLNTIRGFLSKNGIIL